jgi:low affinity Fe/Cu permease
MLSGHQALCGSQRRCGAPPLIRAPRLNRLRYGIMIARIHRWIGNLSGAVADFAGHAMVQLAVLVTSVTWLIVPGSEVALASTMTIGGFILTQMVLSQQRRRENAPHLKIDNLLVAMNGARSELAGAEHAPDEEIERLRDGRAALDSDPAP